MKKRSLVLLSGGLDSAYSLTVAHRDTDVVYGLCFDYGQASAKQEIRASRQICVRFGIPHKVMPLPFFSDITHHPLLGKEPLPELNMNELDDKTKTTQSAKAVWVPNRNGIFLNIAAGLAEMIEVDFLYTGFNVEEAGTFPDNTQDFVSALNHCFTFSTLHNVMVQSPPIKMTKTQIVAELVKQNFPFELLWSCYRGGEQMCGLCESCLRLKRALNACGLQA